MVYAMRWCIFLVNGHHGFADIVRWHDVDSILRTQRKHGHPRQKMYRLHHVELRSLWASAVPEHNGRPENRLLHVWEQTIRHVLAKLFCPRIRVVIGPLPVNGTLFGYHFIFSFSRDG